MTGKFIRTDFFFFFPHEMEYLKMIREKTPNENLPNNTWDTVE